MRPSRQWRLRLQDTVDAAARVESYTAGMTFEEFRVDRKTIDAVERNIILVGEAATHVPGEVVQGFPDVPWRKMRDMRNVVVHGYWGIELPRLWATARDDLPSLIPILQEVLEQTD